MTYFNTNGLSGGDLDKAEEKTLYQKDIILKIFKEYPRAKFTPYDVQQQVLRIYGHDYLITSVRRAMTELSSGDNAVLIKSEKADGKGLYKSPNHLWQLACQSKEIAA